jgi:intein-encoded DNA endonuclease-like protein
MTDAPPQSDYERGKQDGYAEGYCAAMADSDGSIHMVSATQVGITFRQARTEILELTRKYLLHFRILSSLRGPYSQPGRHDMYSLVIHGKEDVLMFVRKIGFRQVKRARRAQNYLRGRSLYEGEEPGEL